MSKWRSRLLWALSAACIGAAAALILDCVPRLARPHLQVSVALEQPIDGTLVLEVQNKGFVSAELNELYLWVFVQQAYLGRRNVYLRMRPLAGRVQLAPRQRSAVLFEPAKRSSSDLVETLYDPGFHYPRSLAEFTALASRWEARCMLEAIPRDGYIRQSWTLHPLVPCEQVWPVIYAFVEIPE